jgi:RNA polymerase sigma factor FliA
MSEDRSAAPLSSLTAASGSDAASADGPPAYRTEVDETELIKRYVPTVKRLAAHLKGRLPEAVPLDDLVQAGLIAVLRTARRSDCLRIGEAMLRRSIINAMIDEARRSAWAPTRTVRLAKAALTAMRVVRHRQGRDGSDEEIAAELGITLDQYNDVLVELAGISLLDLDGFDCASEPTLQIAGDQDELVRQSQLTAALGKSIASLPTRERLVVSLYYEHELNMEEVGQVLGLNKATISRSHGRALLMLRHALADWSPTSDPTTRRAGD